MKAGPRAAAAPLAATAVAALGFRTLYLRQLGAMPAFREPVLDGAAHLDWARGLLAGTWPAPEAFFRAPGYVAWLAAELAVLGSPAAVTTFQILFGAVTAVLTAELARRMSGPGAAWAAGIGAAVYPMFPFFDGQFLAPALAVPLAVGAGIATLAAVERPGSARIAAAGLLWSVCAAVRPPLLLAALVLPAFLFRSCRGRALASLAWILLIPLLLTARNAAVGDPVFVAGQGGLNFYLGNHAGANGVAATFPDRPDALGYRMIAEAERIAEAAEGRALGAAAVSRYWTGRTIADIGEAPLRWAGLLVKKSFLFWHDREIPNNHDPALFAEHLPLLRWAPGWALWAPLGILGFALGRKRTGVRIAGVIVIAVLAACVVFFVNARFRIPAAPFLIALGGGAIAALAARARREGPRALLPAVVALAALVLFVRWNPYGLPRGPWVTSYVLAAEAEAGRGENVRALRWIDRALEQEPNLYAARVAQIDLLRRTGRLAEARGVAQRAAEALPGDPALRARHAELMEMTGDAEAALRELDDAVRIDPAYDPARVSRAIVLARLGRGAEATEALRAFLRERPRSPETARAAELLRRIEAGELAPGAGRP